MRSFDDLIWRLRQRADNNYADVLSAEAAAALVLARDVTAERDALLVRAEQAEARVAVLEAMVAELDARAAGGER